MLPHVRRFAFRYLSGMLLVSMSVVALLTCSRQTTSAQSVHSPSIARPFALRDVKNVQRSLNDYKGRGTVVYFFCGCEWCQNCARAWSDMQKEGALPQDTTGKTLQTLMVFAGDAAATRAFAALTGLDTKQNLLLPDPDLRVTTDYNVGECPRVFVLDGDSFVRYTNNHPYDAPRKAPALVIVSNAIGAMRAAVAAPVFPCSLCTCTPCFYQPLRSYCLGWQRRGKH